MRLLPRHFILVTKHVRLVGLIRPKELSGSAWKWSCASFHCMTPKRSIFPIQDQETYDTDVPDIGQPMEAWFYDVNKDGIIKVRSAMDVQIQPLDPQKHPKMDKLFINMMYLGKEKLNSEELAALTKRYIVSVDMDEDNRELEISIRQKSESIWPALCHLQVPIKYGIDVTCTQSGDASVAYIEGEKVQVKTQHGDCVLENIKSGSVNIQTKTGNVYSTSLIQGNVTIKCGGAGEINTGKLQGQKVKCHSHEGDIKVKALYAEKASFCLSSGNIHLGSCHGNSDIDITEGNLTVDSLDGNLKGNVTCGNTEIAMSREGNVNLCTDKGDISIKVPESVNSTVELTALEVQSGSVAVNNAQITEEKNLTKFTGQLGKDSGNSMISAKTKDGKIQLSYYSWLSSLNIGNPCS